MGQDVVAYDVLRGATLVRSQHAIVQVPPPSSLSQWTQCIAVPSLPPSPLISTMGVMQSVNPNTLAAALGGSTFRDTSAASEAASFRDGMPPPSKGTITSYPLEACVVLLVRWCAVCVHE